MQNIQTNQVNFLWRFRRQRKVVFNISVGPLDSIAVSETNPNDNLTMRRAGLSKVIAFPSKLSIVHAALEFTWSAWLNYNNFCCSSNRANWAKYLLLAFLDAIASPKSSLAEVDVLATTAKYPSVLAQTARLQKKTEN